MSALEDVLPPILRTPSKVPSAAGLRVAPDPIMRTQAMEASDPEHALAPEPNVRTNAVDDPARVHDFPASIVHTIANDCAAQGTSGAPLVSPDRSASHLAAGDGWRYLRLWAEMFYDAQKCRIACENRISNAPVSPLEYLGQLAALEKAENEMRLGLVRCYRRIVPKPIIEWQKASRGIGEHSLARLLGQLGHPAIAIPYHWEDTPGGPDKRELVADPAYPRSLRQLWSYCGHGDATRRRREGMSQEDAFAMGSPACKMIVHALLAVACIKQHESPYRGVYLDRREATADRDWTDGHSHNDALRITGKEILRDLWIASRKGDA